MHRRSLASILHPTSLAALLLLASPTSASDAPPSPPFLEALKSDLVGTLGWRPDLLTRLEALYPQMGVEGEPASAGGAGGAIPEKSFTPKE